MTAGIWSAIGSLLLIIIGLWKFFRGKEAKKQKQKEDAGNEIKQANKDGDASGVTGGLDSLRRIKNS